MPTTLQSNRPFLRIAGRDYELVADNLASLRVDEEEGGLSSAELRFTNLRREEGASTQFAFPDATIFAFGAVLEIGLGDESAPNWIFKGYITAIGERHTDVPELLVCAEDALVKARLSRRTAVYPDASLDDVGGAVAQRIGLRWQNDAASVTLGTVVQLDESDLAFLRRVIAPFDLDIRLDDDTLVAYRLPDRRANELELDAQTGFVTLELTADLAHQVSQVTVSGWDDAQGARILEASSPSSLGPGSGTTGGAVLERAFSRRSEHVGHVPVRTSSEARALADTAHARRARRFVQLSATCPGDPTLRVGTLIRLTGTTRRFANTYLVVRTCHRWDQQVGYEADFDAECAYLAEA